MVTIYDVAKRANVSAMTVSRVINNHKSIKEETKQRVYRAIEELDYIPNKSAQSLTSKDSKLLSLLITDITNPFFTNIARGAEDKASERGYQVVFSNSDENMEKETSYIRAAISRGIDGILFAPTSDHSIKNAKLLQKHNIPYVLVDREISELSVDLVIGDNQQSVQKIMQHLTELGHERIAFISGPTTISNTRERKQSYDEFIQENNLMYKPSWSFSTELTKINLDKFIENMLSEPTPERPTAIVSTNNFIAVNLVNKLKKHQFQIPTDISVVCFDDPNPSLLYEPFFTLVKQPAYDFGYLGMELLIDRIEGKKSSAFEKMVLPTELVIGDSSGPYINT